MVSANLHFCRRGRGAKHYWLEIDDDVKLLNMFILCIGEGMLPTRLPSLVNSIEFCGVITDLDIKYAVDHLLFSYQRVNT